MVKRREAADKKNAPKKPAARDGGEGESDDLYAALGAQIGFDEGNFDPADLGDPTADDDQFFMGDEDAFDEPVRKRGRKARPARPAAPPASRKAPTYSGRPTGRPPLTPGVLLLNLIGALLVGALAMLLFLIVAIAINGGLRALGVDLAEVIGQNQTQAADSMTDSMTEAAPDGEAVAALPLPVCPGGDMWWGSQSQSFNLFTSLYYVVTFMPTAPEDVTRAIASAQTRSDAIRDSSGQPCIIPARVQMLGGAESMLRALSNFNSGTPAPEARVQANDAFDTLVATLPLLWDLEIVTSPDAPPALAIPRGGDDTCSPAAEGNVGAWWAVAGPAWSEFRTVIASIDLATLRPEDSVPIVTALQTAYTQADAAPAVGCAEPLKRLLMEGMNSHISALDTAIMNQVEPTRAAIGTYWQNTAQVQAWLSWLGIDSTVAPASAPAA